MEESVVGDVAGKEGDETLLGVDKRECTKESTSIWETVRHAFGGRYLPYNHIITSYIESALVDLNLGGCSLSAYDTIDMADPKAMKYHYICREHRLISEEVILDGKHYEGYKSPYFTNPPVDFNERNYLEWSFLFPHGVDGDDEV
ncbi:hypothetical protein Scep_019439 [Stephania cephalantha]|uniref:Uncharacterized protein n=1 Tax=Stephania cephalantha TaxID=152367 RepID=A0AAP0IAW9_9MAGN